MAALAASQASSESPLRQASTAAQIQISWDECVRKVSANNPDLLAAKEAVNNARAIVLASYSPFLPQLSANGTVNKSNTELDTGYSDSTLYEANLQVEQNIFNGFRDIAQLNQNRARFSAAQIKLQRVKADLSANLRQAFTRLLFAQDFSLLAEIIESRRKENVSLVEMRFEAGRENKGSLLRSMAFYHQAIVDVSQAKREILVAQRNLNTVLGRYEDENVAVTGAWNIVSPEPQSDFLELVKATPDYREADTVCTASREGVRIAQSEFYPTWSVAGMIGRRDDDSYIPLNNEWSVGTFVSLPVFNGGHNIFATRAAYADLRNSQAKLTSIANTTAFTLEERFATWQNAVERAKLQAEFLDAAQVRVEIARTQYENGLMSFEDWDIIENDLIEKQKTKLTSDRDAVYAQAAWEKAVGTAIIP